MEPEQEKGLARTVFEAEVGVPTIASRTEDDHFVVVVLRTLDPGPLPADVAFMLAERELRPYAVHERSALLRERLIAKYDVTLYGIPAAPKLDASESSPPANGSRAAKRTIDNSERSASATSSP